MKINNMDGKEKTGKLLFEIGFLIMAANVVAGVEIYQSILHHWKVVSDTGLFLQAYIKSPGSFVLTYLNQKSIYLYVLSVIFSFLGNKEELVLIFNLILKLAGILFFYLGVRKMNSFVLPFIFAFFCAGLSICFYPVIEDTPIHMVWFLTGVVFWICTKLYYDISLKYIKWILCGIGIGFFCYVDFSGLLLLLMMAVMLWAAKEYSWKDKFCQMMFYCLGGCVSFLTTFCLWNRYRCNISLLMQWYEERVKMIDSSERILQYSCILGLFVLYLLFAAFSQRKKPSFTDTMEPDAEIQKSEDGKTPVFTQKEEKSEENGQTQELEVPAKVNFIANPLPLPKKHVKKELNYAFDPSMEQMHYDLNNYRLDDDYDLKDI